MFDIERTVCGETGRRIGFKHQYREVCGFESLQTDKLPP